MDISEIKKVAQKFLIDNSPTILTTVGVVGTVSTAVLTGRASYRAAELIADERSSRINREALTGKEKLELTWTLYIPPFTLGVLTVASVMGANHISTRRAAGLAAAYSLSEKAFAEYREKIVTKLGEKGERGVRDEVAQDRVNNTVGSREVIIVGTDVLCYDAFTGRYFNGSVDGLKKAENEINHRILNDGYASLSDLYDLIGLAKTESSDEVGWRSEKLFEFEFSTVLSEDGRPCIYVGYRVEPVREYWRFG